MTSDYALLCLIWSRSERGRSGTEMGAFGINVRFAFFLLHPSSRSGVLVGLTQVSLDSYVQDGRVSTVRFGGCACQGQVFRRGRD